MSGNKKIVIIGAGPSHMNNELIRAILEAHKPEPNESPSSPRTRGSLAASPGQNEVEGTVLNSPPFSGRAESSLSQTGCEVDMLYNCDECELQDDCDCPQNW